MRVDHPSGPYLRQLLEAIGIPERTFRRAVYPHGENSFRHLRGSGCSADTAARMYYAMVYAMKFGAGEMDGKDWRATWGKLGLWRAE